MCIQDMAADCPLRMSSGAGVQASDEAIAGSDHEGADEQTGPVDRH